MDMTLYDNGFLAVVECAGLVKTAATRAHKMLAEGLLSPEASRKLIDEGFGPGDFPVRAMRGARDAMGAGDIDTAAMYAGMEPYFLSRASLDEKLNPLEEGLAQFQNKRRSVQRRGRPTDQADLDALAAGTYKRDLGQSRIHEYGDGSRSVFGSPVWTEGPWQKLP